MSKRNIIFVFFTVFVGILIGLILIYFTGLNKKYAAVFLNNGNIYFGKLSTFPKLKLEKAIFVGFDRNGNITGLYRFEDAFWRPKGTIYLNSENILFIAPIRKDSQIVSLIEGTTQQQSQQVQQPIQPQPPSQQLQSPQPQQSGQPINQQQ